MVPNRLNRFDPRVKISASLLVGLQVVFAGHLLQLAIPVGIVLAGLLAVRWSAGETLRLVRSVWWLGVFIVGTNALTLPGRVAVALPGVSLTAEGLEAGSLLFGRVVMLVLLSRLFVLTTPLTDLIDTLDASTGRLRVVLQPFLTLLGVTLGMAPVLASAAGQVRRSYLARGGRTGLIPGLRFARVAATPLFVLAFRSADHLAEAMETRGFTPRGERTPFRRLRTGAKDWMLLLCVAGLTLAAIL